ncbi:MAG: exosortase U [Fuerstiella sp.]
MRMLLSVVLAHGDEEYAGFSTQWIYMSESTQSIPAEQDRHRWLVPALVAAGFLPLLYWHIGGLLERPHYQFLFLLPLALWLLNAGSEPVSLEPLARRELIIGNSLLLVALAGLVFATWAWSPWVAAVSGMFGWFGVMLVFGGWRCVRNWFSVWVFCWIVIPLPFGMDEDLIVRLRGVTTRISSSVLDQLGVLHNSYANVIELPGKPLFIADACSGIHSLYVLMAAALFLCMWLQRGVVHTIFLLASTFALVLIENVARIGTVAVALGWRMDLSMGWKHEALGFLLFCLSLVFVFTTDQLLMFILPSRIPSLLNWVYEWQTGEGESRDRRRRTKPAAAGSGLQKAVVCLAAIFPVVGAAQLVRMPENAPGLASVLQQDFDLPPLGAETLPQQAAGFQREDYQTVERVFGDPLGQASQQWYYRRGDLTAMVSIDYPYDGIHDLCVCYSQIGWQIERSRVIPADEVQKIAPEAAGAVAIGYLKRPLYGNAVLLFQLCDMQGHVDAVVKEEARGDVDDRAASRFEAFGEAAPNKNVGTLAGPPYVQTQILARLSRPFTEQETDDLLRLFVMSQNILRARALEFSEAKEAK